MIKPPRLNNDPTKTAPHRWCKFLHFWQSVVVAPVALIVFLDSIFNFIFVAASGAALLFLAYVVRGRKTDADLYMEDLADRKNRAAFGSTTFVEKTTEDGDTIVTPVTVPMQLHTHPVWARIAVGFDIFNTGQGIMYSSVVLHSLADGTFDTVTRLDHARNGRPLSAVEIVIVGFFSVGMVLFGIYAHHKASKPRKPRRQRMWLFGTQSQGS